MRRNVCHSVTEIPYPSLDDKKSVQNLVISADWMMEWSHSFIKDLQWNNRLQLSQSVGQLVNQSVNQSVSQLASQPVSHQPVGQSIIQPVSLSVNKSVSQSVSKSMILVKNCKFPFRLFQEKQALKKCLTIIQLENKSSQTIKY